VASRWARLNATAYLGVDDVRIVCMGESVTHPRARLGTRQVPLGSPRCRNGKRSRVLLSVPFDPPNRGWRPRRLNGIVLLVPASFLDLVLR
jgi:hypothetical protein